MNPDRGEVRGDDRERVVPGLRLIDLLALVVGYGLASVLTRAFWPSFRSLSPLGLLVLLGEFSWLGLAMSGPVLLALRRSPSPEPSATRTEPSTKTWAELAWLIIGYYWIGLTILVVPIRTHDSRLVDTAILGLFPFLAAISLRFLGPRLRISSSTQPGWTHRAAILLLLTWPPAWLGLILLGKSLP